LIIGLTGYAQSGKDSVANILVENYGYQRIAFADPIRKLLYEMNPTVKDGGYRVQGVVDGYGWDVAKTAFPEIRTLLQTLGVGARKTFGDMFWVNQALSGLQLFGEANYVITDVRYPNEAKAIRGYDNSQIWRIKRSGVDPVNTHASETAMDGEKVDQIFVNNGTLEDLKVLISTRMRAYI
jgi:hypothetical protein